jgi:hypothetical protein
MNGTMIGTNNAGGRGRGFGHYVKGEEISTLSGLHVGDLLLAHSNQFDADNTILVSRDYFPEAPGSRIHAHFVNPRRASERAGSDFCIWGDELSQTSNGTGLWRACSAIRPRAGAEPFACIDYLPFPIKSNRCVRPS